MFKTALEHAKVPTMTIEAASWRDSDQFPLYRMLVIPTFQAEHIHELTRTRIHDSKRLTKEVKTAILDAIPKHHPAV